MVHLFATLPSDSSYDIPVATVQLSRRLAMEWQAFVVRSNALRKVFVSVKGFYYQVRTASQSYVKALGSSNLLACHNSREAVARAFGTLLWRTAPLLRPTQTFAANGPGMCLDRGACCRQPAPASQTILLAPQQSGSWTRKPSMGSSSLLLSFKSVFHP